MLLFDTFGTTADWHGSLTAYCGRIGAERGFAADWPALVTEWRSLYPQAVALVREGKRPWAGFDELHRETLDGILPKYGLGTLADADRHVLVRGWDLLIGWPDAVDGLLQLKQQYVIGAFSNGTTRQLVDMAKHAGFAWDVILGADQFATYKPAPAMYLGALRLLNAPAETVMLVAAHNSDLQAAASHGLQTAFIYRPTEDLEPTAAYTCRARDFKDLAAQLAR